MFQPFHSSRMEWAIQTSNPDSASGGEDEEPPKAHNNPTIRKPVPQETYKPARQQKEFWGTQAIEFFVNGEQGICLSDASEGNLDGFDGRDDRSLFGDDRLQIMVRLHMRRLPTIILTSLAITNFPSSLLGVCHGNQR